MPDLFGADHMRKTRTEAHRIQCDVNSLQTTAGCNAIGQAACFDPVKQGDETRQRSEFVAKPVE